MDSDWESAEEMGVSRIGVDWSRLSEYAAIRTEKERKEGGRVGVVVGHLGDSARVRLLTGWDVFPCSHKGGEAYLRKVKHAGIRVGVVVSLGLCILNLPYS